MSQQVSDTAWNACDHPMASRRTVELIDVAQRVTKCDVCGKELYRQLQTPHSGWRFVCYDAVQEIPPEHLAEPGQRQTASPPSLPPADAALLREVATSIYHWNGPMLEARVLALASALERLTPDDAQMLRLVAGQPAWFHPPGGPPIPLELRRIAGVLAEIVPPDDDEDAG